MGKPLPLPFYKHNHLNGFHNASDLVSPHFRPLDVIFHPCGRKIAQLATGTDKSGKLTLFSVPININSPDGVTQRHYYTN